jgi:hypothetical protein
MWNEERGDGWAVESDGRCCGETTESCANADGSYFVKVVLVFVECNDVLGREGRLNIGWDVIV